VSYILQHILHFLPTYRLLLLEVDFTAGAEKTLELTRRILVCNARDLLKTALRLRIQLPEEIPAVELFEDDLSDFRLVLYRDSHKVSSPEDTVEYLATAFLNLADEARFAHVVQNDCAGSHADPISDPISEERLRNLKQKFHNLQSLYDTYISDSTMESLDERLPVLRGHISVTFHLLETATALSQYCERHILSSSSTKTQSSEEIADAARLLEVRMRFSQA
jgi:hypothetical protein